jgi:hypothetical protein
MWGILPIGSSILAIFVLLALPERRRVQEPIAFPAPAAAHESAYLREGVK